MLEESADPAAIAAASPIYFRCAHIALMMRILEQRGVSFDGPPHRIADMEDHDLWMAFFRDPDGQVLALMQEAPKGYVPLST
jgi:methylmalonyl-CoA/ethylmalonyl-CoA epimerase